MKHAIACFRAGRSGQPLPVRADKSTGQIVAIASAVGAGTGLLGFGVGALVGRRKGKSVDDSK